MGSPACICNLYDFLQEQVSSMGNSAFTLKLCVVVKKKLQTFFWKNRDFIELQVMLFSFVQLSDLVSLFFHVWCVAGFAF